LVFGFALASLNKDDSVSVGIELQQGKAGARQVNQHSAANTMGWRRFIQGSIRLLCTVYIILQRRSFVFIVSGIMHFDALVRILISSFQ